jgi:hypothetical protein
MEKYKGLIWIRNTTSGSKSDGNKAYFIDAEFKHYQLYQKGVFEINDPYFNPYHLKTVEITAEIQKEKWMMVETIEFFDSSVSSLTDEEEFVFKKSEFDDILNSGGPILNIVEQEFVTADGTENYRLWLRAHVQTGIGIYAKVNETALLFFFQGRLSVRELFLLRNDEVYVIEERADRKSVFKQKYYSEKLDADYLRKIPCADMHFYSISEGMRLQNPFEEVMKKLDMFFINSHETQPTDNK